MYAPEIPFPVTAAVGMDFRLCEIPSCRFELCGLLAMKAARQQATLHSVHLAKLRALRVSDAVYAPEVPSPITSAVGMDFRLCDTPICSFELCLSCVGYRP